VRRLERSSDRVAFLILVGALLVFAWMQFLPCSHSFLQVPGEEPGWEAFFGHEIWRDILPSVADLRDPDMLDLSYSAGFLLHALLVVSCPLLVVPVSHSRLLWWALVLCSGMCAISLVGVLGWFVVTEVAAEPNVRLGVGVVPFFAAPMLNLIGLLLVRKAGGRPAGEAARAGSKLPQA